MNTDTNPDLFDQADAAIRAAGKVISQLRPWSMEKARLQLRCWTVWFLAFWRGEKSPELARNIHKLRQATTRMQKALARRDQKHER